MCFRHCSTLTVPRAAIPGAGSDFGKHESLGTVLAGFHYDLNLLTIHGKSRFPGLSVWLRDGRCGGISPPSIFPPPDKCVHSVVHRKSSLTMSLLLATREGAGGIEILLSCVFFMLHMGKYGGRNEPGGLYVDQGVERISAAFCWLVNNRACCAKTLRSLTALSEIAMLPHTHSAFNWMHGHVLRLSFFNFARASEI